MVGASASPPLESRGVHPVNKSHRAQLFASAAVVRQLSRFNPATMAQFFPGASPSEQSKARMGRGRGQTEHGTHRTQPSPPSTN